MLKPILIASLVGTTFLVGACKPGYNRIYDNSDPDEETRDCVEAPITSTASDKTKKVFELVAGLSCDRTNDLKDLVLVGQSLGAGNQIADATDEDHSYEALAEELADSTGRYPAIISIDYEEVDRFDETALNEAHEILKSHADSDGIVSITWTPLNPWKTSDANEPLTPSSEENDISILYGDDDGSDAWNRFNTQLTLVSKQLKALSEMGVPVLFSPLPQMNIKERWYGAHEDNSAAKFVSLWNHVYSTINEQQPTNLIWVYSPRWGNINIRKSATWGYPDAGKVDVIGGVIYSNSLEISDYEAYEALDKPIGLTRLAPETFVNGTFDNMSYINLLSEEYPFIAYWIAEHNTPVAGEDSIKRAIISNINAEQLMQNNKTATRTTIDTKNWLDI